MFQVTHQSIQNCECKLKLQSSSQENKRNLLDFITPKMNELISSNSLILWYHQINLWYLIVALSIEESKPLIYCWHLPVNKFHPIFSQNGNININDLKEVKFTSFSELAIWIRDIEIERVMYLKEANQTNENDIIKIWITLHNHIPTNIIESNDSKKSATNLKKYYQEAIPIAFPYSYSH